MNILLPETPTEGRETLGAYRARGGYRALERALSASPDEILESIESSGLRGRGGAAFPAGRKWRLTRETEDRERYVVCNGGEDEPGSFKDRYLMEHHPHLLLEGAAIAACALGARRVFLYINKTFDLHLDHVAAALEELGGSETGKRLGLEFEIVPGPTEYVAGEDTALLEVLEGKQPIPRAKPPYPVEAGYRGHPTLVHNVETLANVPFIVREGAGAFRSVGTAESPGTMLFYLNEDYRRPGVYELPFGTPLRRLVEELGGGLASGKQIQAILPGGPSTAFLPAGALDTPLSDKALAEAGSFLGCGNVRLYPEGACMVRATLEIADFFARESCAKCPQCQMETNAFRTTLEKILSGEGNPALLPQFQAIADFSRGKGDCSLIHMAATPVISAVRHFAADFEAHVAGRDCPAAGSTAEH